MEQSKLELFKLALKTNRLDIVNQLISSGFDICKYTLEIVLWAIQNNHKDVFLGLYQPLLITNFNYTNVSPDELEDALTPGLKILRQSILYNQELLPLIGEHLDFFTTHTLNICSILGNLNLIKEFLNNDIQKLKIRDIIYPIDLAVKYNNLNVFSYFYSFPETRKYIVDNSFFLTKYCIQFTNNLDMLKLILSSTRVREGYDYDDSLLIFAIKESKNDMAEYLLEYGHEFPYKAMTHLIEQSNFNGVKFYIEHNQEINRLEMFTASLIGNYDIIKLMLENGSPPDQDSFVFVPERGTVEIAKLFVEHGADPTDRRLVRNAARADNLKMLKYFLSFNPEITGSALFDAASEGESLETISYIYQIYANSLTVEDLLRALETSSKEGNWKVFLYILSLTNSYITEKNKAPLNKMLSTMIDNSKYKSEYYNLIVLVNNMINQKGKIAVGKFNVTSDYLYDSNALLTVLEYL